MTASSPTTPVSIAAGQQIVDEIALTNVTSSTLTDGNAIVAVIPPDGVKSGAGTPYLAWRYDGGPWHQIGLSWVTPSGSGPSWQGSSFVFGASWAPGATHTLELETEFATSSPNGEYSYEIAGGADPCQEQALFVTMAFSEYAQGWKQPTHSSSPAPPAPTITRSTPAQAPATRASVNTHTSSATSPTAKASSASPSPVTPSPSAVSPSASSVPSSSETPTVVAARNVSDANSDRSSLWLVLVIAFGVLVLLAAAVLMVRRRSRQ